MNLEKLLAAVKLANYTEAVTELEELKQRMDKENLLDIWKNESQVTVVSQDMLADVLDDYFYDEYGKYARQNNNEHIPFEKFAEEITKAKRLPFNIRLLTTDQLRLGWDISADLWHENELQGDNDAEGKFIKD